jgi:hypothetical protein
MKLNKMQLAAGDWLLAAGAGSEEQLTLTIIQKKYE